MFELVNPNRVRFDCLDQFATTFTNQVFFQTQSSLAVKIFVQCKSRCGYNCCQTNHLILVSLPFNGCKRDMTRHSRPQSFLPQTVPPQKSSHFCPKSSQMGTDCFWSGIDCFWGGNDWEPKREFQLFGIF